MLEKQGYVHARTYAHAPGHKHARAHKHKRTQTCNIYYFSTATMIRKRDSVLRRTYIVSLIIHFVHTL